MTVRRIGLLLAAALALPSSAFAGRALSFTGQAVGPGGPLAGARVTLLKSFKMERTRCIGLDRWVEGLRRPDPRLSLEHLCACVGFARKFTRDPRERVAATGVTDALGGFALSAELEHSADKYVIVVAADGLAGTSREFHVRGAGPTGLVVEARPVQRYSGVVRDFDGRPLGGATVRAVPVLAGGATAASGEDGSYSLEIAADCPAVVATKAGHLPFLAPRGEPAMLIPTVTLEGVVLSGGAPAPGASLTVKPACALPVELVADGAGRFSVPDVAPLSARIEAYGGTLGTRVVTEVPASGAPVTIALQAGGSVSGTVLDSRGAPVAGATVVAKANRELRVHEDVTDSAGAYEISVPGKGSYSMSVKDHPSLGRSAYLREQGATVSHDIRLMAVAPHFEGLVVGTDGSPISGASVVVGYQRAPREPQVVPPLQSCQATTDVAGRFVCEGLVYGNYSLGVRAEGGAQSHHRIVLPAAPGQQFVIERAATVRGRLLTARGEPVSRQFVALHLDLYGQGIRATTEGVRRDSALTDADGAFSLQRVASGRYLLVADVGSGEDSVRFVSEAFVVEEGVSPPPIEFVVGREPRIQGTVARPALAERPMLEPEVLAYSGRKAEGRPVGRSIAQSDGAFSISVPKPGEYTLVARAPDFVQLREARARAGQTDAVIPIAPGAAVRGQVLLADGRPAGSFTVDAQRFGSPDGRFELPSVRAGPVRLRIEAGGLPSLEHHFRLEAGTDVELPPLRLRAKEAPRPQDPNEQLAALERFGKVPPCRSERSAHGRGRAAPGKSEPPPAPLKHLAGKTAELEPYLDTPYDRVLTRVITLLCAIGDDEARKALVSLQERHPCPVLWTVGDIVASEETGRRGGRFDPARECGPGRSFSSGGTEYRTSLAEEILAWTNPSARERARRISDGDFEAFREALWDQGKLDPLARREALAALAGIDTLPALRELVREELNGFEIRWRCPSADCSRDRGFLPGVGGAALVSVARRSETDRARVLARVADGLTESEARELVRLAWQENPLKAELAGMLEKPKAPGVPTAGGAAFLEEGAQVGAAVTCLRRELGSRKGGAGRRFVRGGRRQRRAVGSSGGRGNGRPKPRTGRPRRMRFQPPPGLDASPRGRMRLRQFPGPRCRVRQGRLDTGGCVLPSSRASGSPRSSCRLGPAGLHSEISTR